MTRPDYIARGGDIVMAPPFNQRGTTMYSFLVGADLAALTRLVDEQLNRVAQPCGTIYKPALPMAAIVCADITQSFSLTPPDSQKGWMTERDFGIWIPVLAGKVVHGVWEPDRIAWYLPYVFVDNVAAMVTGREVYGFFKQTAALAMPASPWSPGMFAIDALVIPTFAPSSQAEVLRLLTITSCEAVPAPAGTWHRAEEACDAIRGRIRQIPCTLASDATVHRDAVKRLVDEFSFFAVSLVFLKQFRDAGDPTKACYQAVIEAPPQVEKFYGGWYMNPHSVSITPCASHPIVAECGLAGDKVVAEFGVWCKMDFVMKSGTVIAESS